MYFAKYLPVEGDIKEGDYGIWDGNIGQAKDWKTLESLQYLNAKKVKLFLCSRDIQAEDIVIWDKHPDRKCEVISLRENAIEVKHDYGVHWLDPLWICKKVGEISPEATWVVENEEFDRVVLEPWLWCNEHPDESMYMEIEELEQWNRLNPTQTYYTPRIKIKCPNCKHFH